MELVFRSHFRNRKPESHTVRTMRSDRVVIADANLTVGAIVKGHGWYVLKGTIVEPREVDRNDSRGSRESGC